MPYNSSSFERQLAKYKQAQVEKSVADMPRKRYEVYEDPHKVSSKINSDRGSIKSYALDPVQLMGEGGQISPVVRAKPDPFFSPIIVKSKKVWYKRTWFILLVLTTLPTLAAPIFYKDEMKQLMDVAGSLKTSTGVDPFAVSTYTNLIRGKSSNPAEPPADPAGSILGTGSEPVTVDPHQMAEPMDMHNAVEKAQAKADAITSKGAGYSMQYIEDETKRLNDMAKEFDKQYKK